MMPPASIGALGYATAAVLLGILGALLLTSWRGRLQGAYLLLAVAVSVLWASLLAAQAQWRSIPIELIWAAESMRMLVWALFLLRVLAMLHGGNSDRLAGLRWTIVCGALLLALPLEGLIGRLPGLLSTWLGSIRLIGQVMLIAAGLFLLEQIYRNTPWEHRWGIKFLCFGLGALFAYDFYFFADALLFGRIDPGLWLARGAVNAVVVPFIAVSVARNPQWSFDISVSRSVVIHSTTLIAAGLYLLFMALAGYYIRYYGGEWSTVFQPVFFFGAGLLLVVLLFSGQLRSHLKVFVNKHFFSYRYDYREEWLRLIRVLSGKVLQAPLPDRIIYALCELVESPGGAIWVTLPDGSCEFRRCWNVSEADVDQRWDAQTLCQALQRDQAIVDIESAAHDDVALPNWLFVRQRFWLLVPLFHEERLMGFVLLAKARIPQRLEWESMQLLETAARQAASYLALDEAASALAQARQFEGFNRLSAFVVHDLKNLIAQLSLITRNAERYRNNPEFVEDAFQTVRNSVDKMTRLLAQLRSAVPSERSVQVALRAVLEALVVERGVQDPRPMLSVEDDVDPCIYADPDRLHAVLGNVIQNAQEATSKDGRVIVRLSATLSGALIEIEDDGCGMEESFVRDRLFRPFDSTKGLAGMGIGAYECREFVTSLGGRVQVASAPGEGTRFAIRLPLEAIGQDLATTAEAL
jgi:putative PEP-CTERM system histidine kinase